MSYKMSQLRRSICYKLNFATTFESFPTKEKQM